MAAIVFGFILLIFGVAGIRIIRPTHRAVIERLGKYKRFQNPGIIWIIPFVEKQISVNITEQMTEAEEQETITKDNLNARIDAQVYFKVKPDEETVKAALYNVYNYHDQIVALAQTSLRNVIGGKEFVEVNSKRNELNKEIQDLLTKETANWGIDIVKVELKQITPPKNVQDTMNSIIEAANKKTAAIDNATARETEADGLQRARVKEATGIQQAAILEADGNAQAIEKIATATAMKIRTIAEAEAKRIEIVNDAANKHFIGNAVELKRYETTQASLENNSKVIIAKDGINPTIVLGDTKAIIPIPKKTEDPVIN